LKLHPGLVGIFIGSVYSANVESYRRGRLLLEEAGFRGSMFLVGSINTAPRTDWPEVGFDERWFGFVDDDEKLLLLESADFALQLIYDGAGTNLKLFDYMAAELPIIANAFGSRGVEEEDWFLPVETAADLATTLAALAERPEEAARVAERARRIARERFDWRAIAGDFEARMERGFPAAVD
jgi:glycosyltransferase involved in cell wall biosynthesis